MKTFLFLEKALSVSFWFLLMLGFDSPCAAVLTVISALIHEGGHIIALRLFSKSAHSLPLADISGFRIKVGSLSYKEELIAALSGPVFNLLVGFAILIIPFPDTFKEYAELFGLLNIITAVSNLLPIESFDGYRAADCVLSLLFKDSQRSDSVLYWTSFLFSALMCLISLFVILKLGEGYWLFAVFFSSMLSAIIKRQKYTFYEKNGDFVRF